MEIKFNKYIVKVNIADVGGIVVPHCLDDLNARTNYRNIHLNNAVKMLPFNLRTDLSLNQNHNSHIYRHKLVANHGQKYELKGHHFLYLPHDHQPVADPYRVCLRSFFADYCHFTA